MCIKIVSMEEENKVQRNKFHFFKYYLHNKDNDIKYRGPLTYRHLRIIAWVCMMFMAISIVFSIFGKIKMSDGLKTTANVFNSLGSLALPLFLIANFSIIMRSHNNIKRVLLMHGLTALGLIFVAYAFVFRYVFSVTTHYDSENYEGAKFFVETLINSNPSRYVFLNVFIDLFLCSLSYMFLTYHPKKVFTGKKIILFRLLIILPIVYELVCIYLKLHVLTSDFLIPWYIFPLLTTKPPFLLLAFVVLTLIYSHRKRVYLKYGHTHEEYEEYLKSNANSLSFAIIASCVLICAVIVDLIVFAIVSGSIASKLGVEPEDVVSSVSHSGIGETIPVLLLIPLLFVFSYNTKYHETFNNKLIDRAIPVIGVIACVVAVVESLIQMLATF